MLSPSSTVVDKSHVPQEETTRGRYRAQSHPRVRWLFLPRKMAHALLVITVVHALGLRYTTTVEDKTI